MCDYVSMISRLKKPEGPIDVVLDTDTFNEIDDQYALAYLIKNKEKLNLKAVYAAPFQNRKAPTPGEGMEKSYREIFNVLSMVGRDDLKDMVYKGSASFLFDENTPVSSAAAEHLAALAMEYTEERPLYVIAIAAITNVASAILINPEAAKRMVVVWLGGQSFEWPDNKEYNCRQDVAAVRVVLDSEAAVVLLPCMGVVSGFATTQYELEHWLKGRNALCDYLYEVTVKEVKDYRLGRCWSKPIWDVCAVAWLLDGGFMLDRMETAPIAEYDHRWAFDRTRKPIRYVYHIKRDQLMEDLFTKLAE